MSTVAIIGAGNLGGALACALAGRTRVGEVRLIDPEGRIAEGKALDILQSSPVDSFSTRVTAAAHYTEAAGADAIVLADLTAGGEITGESGLALVKQVAAVDSKAPFLFAGAGQRELMFRAAGELHVKSSRLIGSAPLALESAVRALTAALIDAGPAAVSLAVMGVPPYDAVIAWESATAFNQPIARMIAAHHMAALSARVPALWPPQAYTLGSAAARVAEALASGGRRRYTCFAMIDVAGVGRNIIAAVPVDIVKGGIRRTLEPELSRHERTQFEKGLR
jgi:malate dehydrogenase